MIVKDYEPYTPEWWADRRGMATASEAKRIITPKKWEFASGADSYACKLIADLIDPCYGVQEEFVTAAMKNGTIMEPESRRYYEYTRDIEVRRVGFCISDCGRFGYSPDSLVEADKDGPGQLELKNPNPETHIKWLLSERVPEEHLPQCHFGMLVTKRTWIDFMSYFPGLPPLLLRVYADEKTVKLAEALEKFHKMYTDMKAKILGTSDPITEMRIAETLSKPFDPGF